MTKSTFPTYFTNEHAISMTLRDYFASKAMQGFLSADTDFTLSPDVIAKDAYDMADQMMKAREA